MYDKYYSDCDSIWYGVGPAWGGREGAMVGMCDYLPTDFPLSDELPARHYLLYVHV